MKQCTLKSAFTIKGKGLHTGREIEAHSSLLQTILGGNSFALMLKAQRLSKLWLRMSWRHAAERLLLLAT